MKQTLPLSGKSKDKATAPKKRVKTMKVITPQNMARYFENVGVYYIQRFSSSAAGLRQVLMRRIHKAERAGQEIDRTLVTTNLDALIEKFTRLGWLDDEKFAASRWRTMRDSGQSRSMIERTLQHKGIAGDIITAHRNKEREQDDDHDDAEFHAAVRFAAKKKLGVYRPENKTATDAAVLFKQSQKDLGAMARAGYSVALARRVLQSLPDDNMWD